MDKIFVSEQAMDRAYHRDGPDSIFTKEIVINMLNDESMTGSFNEPVQINGAFKPNTSKCDREKGGSLPDPENSLLAGQNDRKSESYYTLHEEREFDAGEQNESKSSTTLLKDQGVDQVQKHVRELLH